METCTGCLELAMIIVFNFFSNMENNIIIEARYIKNVILPKLQELQRDLYFDKHIKMNIENSGFDYGMSVSFLIDEDRNALSEKFICTKVFLFRTFLPDSRKQNLKALRGVYHFIKNWKQIL